MPSLLPAWSPSAATVVATLLACGGLHAYRIAALAGQDVAQREAQREIRAAESDAGRSRMARADRRPAQDILGLGPRPAHAVLVSGWRRYGPDEPDQPDGLDAPNAVLAWIEPRTLAMSYHPVGTGRSDAVWLADPGTGALRPGVSLDRLSVIPAPQEAQAIAQAAERRRAAVADAYARSAWWHQQAAIHHQCDAADVDARRRTAFIAMCAVLGVGVFAAWALWQESGAAKRPGSGW